MTAQPPPRSVSRASCQTIRPGFRSRGIGVGIILASAACASCTSLQTVQTSVAQFGAAITNTKNAESSLFSAINQKKADFDNIHLLASGRLIQSKDHKSVFAATDSGPATSEIPDDVMTAINNVLKPLQAYGEAMQALSGDSAPTTFTTNVDNLAASAAKFNSTVLQPLVGNGLPSASAINEVGKAIADIGKLVIAAEIAKDVKAAAAKANDPLNTIVSNLKTVNGFWSARLPNNLAGQTIGAAVSEWNTKPRSYDERVALKAIWEKAENPVDVSPANDALDALLKANKAVATAGPDGAKVEIQVLWQAATDAYAAYKALLAK